MTIKHGLTIIEATAGLRTISTVATAVIGLVATGPAADAELFPLDQPALILDLDAAIAKAGATGTLKAALVGIASQTEAPVVVVRVGTDAQAANQAALTIGASTNGVLTGMQALLRAEADCGVKPRILGAPGLDVQAVSTALVVVAQKLRASAYAKAIGADPAAAIAYRENFNARELTLIYDDFVAFDVDSAATAVVPAVAYALGLRARIDQEEGFQRSLSNVPVSGIVGINKPVHFDIMDAGSAAGVLNAAGITCLVRREGFRFWGNRTTADLTSPFSFEVAARSAQILIDTIAEGMTWAIDKPLTPGLVTDIVETINAKLRDMVARGYLLGGRATFDRTKNPNPQLAGGKLIIDYDYQPVPPLEDLTLTQHISGEYEAFTASARA